MNRINRFLMAGLFLAVISIIYNAPLLAGESLEVHAGSTEPQAVMDESFEVAPKSTKELSWDCNVPLRILNIAVKSTRDIAFAVIDEQEYLGWKARRAENSLNNKIENALLIKTSFLADKFTVQVPKEGKYHLIINNNCFMSPAKVAIKATY